MRRLMLLRHAKAGPPAAKDIERPLAPRGREAAPRMGRYLAEEQLFPDVALVSSAARTRETWDLVRPHLGDDVETVIEPGIYEASPERLLDFAREVGPSARSVLMIGHNPGFQDLARLLVGFGDRYAFARMLEKFPTAALCVLDFDVDDWSGIAPRGARLDRFVTPRSLGAEEDD
jgi:phosphohistidine phosphatase